MVVWNGKVCNVKKSWSYILTTRSKLVVSQFLNLDFMKMMIKKVHSSSTLPKTTTIANSTSLKYLEILSFKITLKANLFHIWEFGLQSCEGFLAPSLVDCMVVIKKLDYYPNNTSFNKPTCDLASSSINLQQQ